MMKALYNHFPNTKINNRLSGSGGRAPQTFNGCVYIIHIKLHRKKGGRARDVT